MDTVQKVDECLCVVRRVHSECGEWQICHGIVSDLGEVDVAEAIFRMRDQHAIVELARQLGGELQVPVYLLIAGRSAELIPFPALT